MSYAFSPPVGANPKGTYNLYESSVLHFVYFTLSFFLNIIVVTPFSSNPDAAVMSSCPPQNVSTRGVDLNNQV